MQGIDYLIDVLNHVKPDEFCSIERVKELCLQAKEIEEQEKQDNKYSEKELIDFADNVRNNPDVWEWVNPDNLHERKTTKELFEIFKMNKKLKL
jgi:predicted RNA-binding protein with EMAP domain